MEFIFRTFLSNSEDLEKKQIQCFLEQIINQVYLLYLYFYFLPPSSHIQTSQKRVQIQSKINLSYYFKVYQNNQKNKTVSLQIVILNLFQDH